MTIMPEELKVVLESYRAGNASGGDLAIAAVKADGPEWIADIVIAMHDIVIDTRAPRVDQPGSRPVENRKCSCGTGFGIPVARCPACGKRDHVAIDFETEMARSAPVAPCIDEAVVPTADEALVSRIRRRAYADGWKAHADACQAAVDRIQPIAHVRDIAEAPERMPCGCGFCSECRGEEPAPSGCVVCARGPIVARYCAEHDPERVECATERRGGST